MNNIDEMLNLLADKIAERLSLETNASVNKSSDVYFTVDDLCKKFHLSKATIYRHRNAGYLVPTCYTGRKPLFNEASITNYLSNFNS